MDRFVAFFFLQGNTGNVSLFCYESLSTKVYSTLGTRLSPKKIEIPRLSRFSFRESLVPRVGLQQVRIQGPAVGSSFLLHSVVFIFF